jgi:hypothetical protein
MCTRSLTAGFIFLATCVPSLAGTPPAEHGDRVRSAIERSVEFLQTDGRSWFEGEIDIQEKGCVSCHQVPSGLWSIASANSALRRPSTADFSELLADSNKFVASPEDDNGAAAAVSQLLLATSTYAAPADDSTNAASQALVSLALKSQRDDGTWRSKGQFPSQRRPIAESDAVVSMWMIRALQGVANPSPEVAASIERASGAVAQSTGVSTEWVAWRLLLAGSASTDVARFRDQLIEMQNEDASWGWTSSKPGNAYSTGVALFALSEAAPERRERVAGSVAWLLANQSDDGSWNTEGSLISKKSSYSRDYVYRYWGTAWATMGLARHLTVYRHSSGNRTTDTGTRKRD